MQTVRGTPIDHGDHQVTTAAEEGDQRAGLSVAERADKPIDLNPTWCKNPIVRPHDTLWANLRRDRTAGRADSRINNRHMDGVLQEK